MNNNSYNKYIKYKTKYLNLKMNGGNKITLGISSWNIGNNVNIEKISQIKKNIEENDILIFGFQEMPVNLIYSNKYVTKMEELLKTVFSNYKLLGNSSTCKNKISSLKGFGIGLYVLHKTSFTNITNIKYDEVCPDYTKGYACMKIGINDKEIDLITTHMPFNKIEKLINFYNNMNNWLDSNNFKSENRIIFGDVNTRSLLTNECYEKSIKTCDIEQEKKYCSIKEKLESISFENTIKKYNIGDTTNKICYASVDSCSIEQNQSISNLNEITTVLIKHDFIGNPPRKNCNMFNDFNENKIDFLPTYKRSKDGLFSLKKENEGRLPGYADRIFYKGDIIEGLSYKSLPIKGNDHLPIYGVFNIRI